MSTSKNQHVFVVEIKNTDQDTQEIFLFSHLEDALREVEGDIADRYHFDTDEPYCTREELEQKQEEMRKHLLEKSFWVDGDEQYYLDEKEVW